MLHITITKRNVRDESLTLINVYEKCSGTNDK